MSEVTIKINPFEKNNSFNVENQAISPHSQLAGLARQDSWNWMGSIYGALDRHVNENYNLTIIASRFDTYLLNRIFNQEKQNNTLCNRLVFQEFTLNMSVNERYNWIVQKKREYFSNVSLDRYKVLINSYRNDIVNTDYFRTSPIEYAQVIITDDVENIPANKIHSNKPIVVAVNGGSRILFHNQIQGYLMEISENELSNLMELIVEKYYKIPAILSMQRELTPISNRFNDQDSSMFRLITAVSPTITIRDIPRLEVGSEYEIQYDVFPRNSRVRVNVVSSNPNCIRIQNGRLIGVANGRTTLYFYDGTESTHFATKEIEVFERVLVRQIQIRVEGNIETGTPVQVQYAVLPNNAENADEVHWSVSGSGATITETGMLTANRGGQLTIIARIGNVEARQSVNVRSVINRLMLDSVNIELEIGTTETIRVQSHPDNLNRDFSYHSTNEDVAVVETVPGGTFRIRAIMEGTCDVVFRSNNSSASVSCRVRVKRFKERNRTFSSLQMFLIFVALLLIGLKLKEIAMCCSIVSIICGIISIIVNRKEFIWPIILAVIGVVLMMF